MRYKGMLLFLVFSFFSLFLFSGNASAVAISDTSVTLILDWDSYLGVGEWSSGNYAYNGADAYLDGVEDHPTYVGGWVTNPAISLTAQVTADSVGTAETTITSANATAHSRADGIGTNSPPDENVRATATSHRGKSFRPYEDGEITFSFAYTFLHDLTKDLTTEGYSCWSIAEINMTSVGGHSEVVFSDIGTNSGTLSLTVSLLANTWYYLEGHVYTDSNARSPEQASPVPEPVTMLLLGFGLVSLAGFRRKFSKK